MLYTIEIFEQMRANVSRIYTIKNVVNFSLDRAEGEIDVTIKGQYSHLPFKYTTLKIETQKEEV